MPLSFDWEDEALLVGTPTDSFAFSRRKGALPPAASIHPIADKTASRKPLFTLSATYVLGPMLRADSSPQERFRADILLHVWMDIHS